MGYLSGSGRPTHSRRARARPKTRKLETNDELRAQVVEGLAKNWSTQQIAARLRLDHPGDKEMRVCHETIYQAIYVQPRGGLAREVKAAIKRGKVLRHGREHRKHQAGLSGPISSVNMFRFMSGPKRSRSAWFRGIGKEI